MLVSKDTANYPGSVNTTYLFSSREYAERRYRMSNDCIGDESLKEVILKKEKSFQGL